MSTKRINLYISIDMMFTYSHTFCQWTWGVSLVFYAQIEGFTQYTLDFIFMHITQVYTYQKVVYPSTQLIKGLSEEML